jgi:hypothetical protein
MLGYSYRPKHGYFEWTTLNGGVCNQLPAGRRPDTSRAGRVDVVVARFTRTQEIALIFRDGARGPDSRPGRGESSLAIAARP